MFHTRTKRNGMLLAGALSALFVTMTAAPALAQHDRGPRRNGNHAPQPEFTCGIAGCTDRHLGAGPCLAEREYDRGFALGERDGKENGYRDAVHHRPFCDAAPRQPRRSSKFFAIGYADGYAAAYEESFVRHHRAARRPLLKRPGSGPGWARPTGSRWGWRWSIRGW